MVRSLSVRTTAACCVADALAAGGAREWFVAWDEGRGAPVAYDPAERSYKEPPVSLALSGTVSIAGRDGLIACRPAFAHLAQMCGALPPEVAAEITGVDASAIRETAYLLWHHRPLAYFTWGGLEMHSNATQTSRAHAILHALTGCIDVPGGNVHLAQVPVSTVAGNELRPPGQWSKSLGLKQRPLGTARDGWVISDDIYRAVLDAEPYRVRGLVGFGVNLLLSHSDAARGAEALRNLEFHVQTDLDLTPTAAYADIVLPIASAWEREGLSVGFRLNQAANGYVQLRPAHRTATRRGSVRHRSGVRPRGPAWPG